ncbi:MAG TPA: M36 family metallopeptidase, partial [Polyangiaceae bacterium]|nr:M36 family metallopeptidase [Polyangiaceae bacterium]
MCARDTAPADSNPTHAAGASADETAARNAIASTPLAHVSSRDEHGRARVLLGAIPASVGASTQSAAIKVGSETAARLHLERQSSLLGVHENTAKTSPVAATHTLANGASVVQFAQRLNDVEVFRARASVVLDADKNLVSIASSLHPDGTADNAAKSMKFAKTPEAALSLAYAEVFGASLSPGAVVDAGARGTDARQYKVTTSPDVARVVEATAKRIFYPEANGLTPAYYVELIARAPKSKENQAYGVAISAKDGRSLYQASLVANDAFQYRVWADTIDHNIPTDGPYVDYTPHPTGVPDKKRPDYQQPRLVSMEGFNHNPSGVADPWLAPDKTVSSGNNVHAYSDRDDQHKNDDAGNDIGDGFDSADFEATTTAAKTFDRTYNTGLNPDASTDQIRAAVTQIFYVTNWLHDYWYDSGFDEKSGVAQVSNYGRSVGGEGDPLRAEGQDGANFQQSNNANMATLTDGTSPRMQMFVWSALPNRTLTTTPAIAFTDTDFLGAASFGPQTFDRTANAVVSVPADGCSAPTNAGALAGNIAVMDRGTCAFTVKAENAQAAGAVAILLVNNSPGHVAPSPGVPDDTVTIGLLGLSLEDGALLKTAIGNGTVSAHLVRGTETPLHDGTIDNSVIGHEWGHYLHHRLVLCGSLIDPDGSQVGSCGGMSEGWADFDALMLAIREADQDPATGSVDGKVYPLAQYAATGLLANAAYFGIRRAPYSTDMTKNPFTFQHVRSAGKLPTTAPLAPAGANLAEVHNVGEIWAETLFEGYANMLKAGKAATPPRTFQDTKRRLANYIVAGMKATPVEPTFTEQRDAILSTVWATGQKDDFNALAQGFAKRGLGVGAISPPVSSHNLNEAVENFANQGELGLVSVKIDDGGSTCDHDGVLDGGETGQITVQVRNTGWATLTGTTVTASTTDANLTIGSQGTVASLDPYGTATIVIPISAAASATKQATANIDITLGNTAAFTASGKTSIKLHDNF